jgi:MFS family permease
MTRILFMLSTFSVLLLVAAFVVGLLVGDLYNTPNSSTLHWATVHRLTGIVAALVVVLVESVVITYFIGTSRWCKEVVDTYSLDHSAVRESSRLKRRAFAVSLLGMMTILAIIALGAANDPATGRRETAEWNNFHLVAAIVGTLLIAWTYTASWRYIQSNQTIIEQLVVAVGKLRRAKGLEPEAESIRH